MKAELQLQAADALAKGMKEALNRYPMFSAKYVDVKYSENCFREMHASALDALAAYEKVRGK